MEQKIKTFNQKDWLKETAKYKKDAGSWAWIYHRISGIALIGYLFLHIYSLSTLTQGKEAFEAKMKTFLSPAFMVLEWILFIFVLFHSLNGIRIVLVDLADGARYHKQLYRASWVIGVVIFLVMGFVMFSHEILTIFK
ncbi:MAG: succinate dehydrogenase, cytochrome b556 subunit [Ignavibacteria bacterium]